MKPNIKHTNKPMMNRWAAAFAAFAVAGSFSPIGMMALDYCGVAPSLSDCILSAAMFSLMLVVYNLLRKNVVRVSDGR